MSFRSFSRTGTHKPGSEVWGSSEAQGGPAAALRERKGVSATWVTSPVRYAAGPQNKGAKGGSSACHVINPQSIPRSCDTRGAPAWTPSTRAGPRGLEAAHRPLGPSCTPTWTPAPTRQARGHTASHQARGRAHTHPEAWIRGRGSEAGPLSAPCPGPLPTRAAARAAPAHGLPAGAPPRPPCFTQGTCQTPGDDPAMLSARSWEACGCRGPTACRSSITATRGPCSRLSTQPASPHVIFLPQ